MTSTIAPLYRPVVSWPLICAAALVLTIAAPHLGAGDDADPDTAPVAPGCVGCHHNDAEPAPEGGPAAAARRAIATLGLSAR
jgi:cytochrome c553